MKIIVTGGSGLVGRALQSVCQDSEHTMIFLSSADCNLLDKDQIKQLFEKERPDAVIHLAACVGGLFKNMNQKVEMYEKNMLMNHNVLSCCHDYHVKKVVSCLSTCIFPDNTTYPINETMLHNGPPHSSNDAYAYAKRMLEVQSKAYREQYNDNFICVIPTNIYGEHDNYSLQDAHVIPALIHKCYLAKQKGEPFVVCGSGSPLRQFIYSKDLAKLLMWSLLEYQEKDSIILSVSEKDEVSIAQVAYLIAQEYDYEDHMVFDTSYSDGQYKKTADNGKLMNLYPSFEYTNIQTGIHHAVTWFNQNVSSCRK